MLNCILTKEDSLLFDTSDRIWGMSHTPRLLGILRKLRLESVSLEPEEESVWNNLKEKLQLQDEHSLDTRSFTLNQAQWEDVQIPILTPYELSYLPGMFAEYPHKRYIPVLISGETVYVGPCTAEAAVYDSFIRRVAANNPMFADKVRIGEEERITEILYMNKQILHTHRQEIEAAIDSLLQGDSPNTVWIISEGQSERHAFLTFQSNPPVSIGPKDLMNAVDSQLGIITALHTESFPFKGREIFVSVSSTTDYSVYHPDLFAQSNSGAGFDRQSAEYSAIGESIERLAAGCCSAGRKLAAWNEISDEAVCPDDFVLFSKDQYRTEGFAYHPFTRNTTVNWMKADNLMTGVQNYVPAAFVQLPYKTALGETRITPAISTGLALGKSRARSILSGIFEVVERDAFALCWLLRLPPNRRLRLEEYLEGYDPERDEQYVCNAYDITVDHLFTTVAVTIYDRNSSHFMIGAATRFTAEEAVSKAFLEAAQGITYVKMLVNKYKDHGLAADFNKINTFQKHAAFYSLYPELKTGVHYLLDEDCSVETVRNSEFSAAAIRNINDEQKLQLALGTLQRAGFQAYHVDLTNQELEPLGASASRVLIPGLQPLHGAHSFRFLDGKRLDAVRQKYGWHDQLNPYPHPFP